MRKAVIEILFPQANVGEVPDGIFRDANEIAERWGGTVVVAMEDKAKPEDISLFTEMQPDCP